jgi:serine/threonine-protein kinase HipA
MEHSNKINVFIEFADNEELVGQLILDNKGMLFKYSASYLEKGYNISPLKLKFDDSIQLAPVSPFDGLFGVFADSLPDAWGYLLMKKHLSEKGIAMATLNSLDRLTYVGNNALGALIYKPCVEQGNLEILSLDLDSINTNVEQLLSGESHEVIDDIFQQGGSPGGARPKIYVNYNRKKDVLTSGNNALQEGFEHWIIKFASTVDSSDISNVEMAYYSMALEAGVQMNESKLFTGKSGKTYFGTKRFDRIGSHKLHMISGAGLLHDDFERSQMDYGTLMHEGKALVGSSIVHEQVLRLATFNVFAHNRDDHSKNFAFLMDKNGKWSFAPAYDLTFSSSSQGHHSTFVSGNSLNPGTKELLELVDHFSISKGKKIIEEVKQAVGQWEHFATEEKVSLESKSSIQKVIGAQLKH